MDNPKAPLHAPSTTFDSSSGAEGNETTILSILQAMLIHGMILQGTPKGDHYGPVAIGAPDERAELQSRDLGRRVAELAARLSG